MPEWYFMQPGTPKDVEVVVILEKLSWNSLQGNAFETEFNFTYIEQSDQDTEIIKRM